MVLIERDSELALLDGALDELESAGGKVVLIRGEAGVGKSLNRSARSGMWLVKIHRWSVRWRRLIGVG